MKVAFIGFSEAGPAFAEVLVDHRATVTAFDIALEDPRRRNSIEAKAKESGTTLTSSLNGAIAGAKIVISTVTAAAALQAAEAAAGGLEPGQIYLDLNSCSPQTKQAVGRVVSARGAKFVEGVAMGRISDAASKVPLLLCGQAAESCADHLRAFGLNASCIGSELGHASAIKLIRSVLVKGFEAVFSEAIEAAEQAGVRTDVVASLAETFPGADWPKLIDYHLGRVAAHGLRRSEELAEASEFLATMGVRPVMTIAAAERQRLAATPPKGA